MVDLCNGPRLRSSIDLPSSLAWVLRLRPQPSHSVGRLQRRRSSSCQRLASVIMDVARQKARKSKGSSAASSPDKSTSHAPAPTGAIPSDELKPFLLPDGPGLEALGMLPEPVRTATWMSCLFSPSAGTDLEQVVFWKLYQAQFSSFPQPLSDATKVVRAAESRYRPDKIEEKTAEGKMVSRYVLRDIQIRTFTARTMAMVRPLLLRGQRSISNPL